MVILGSDGPIDLANVEYVNPFEHLIFDWSELNPSASLDRISLKNRDQVSQCPFDFLENLKTSTDMLADELLISSSDKTQIIVACGNPKHISDLKAAFGSVARVKLVIAAQLPVGFSTDLKTRVQWLKCAVELGVQNSSCGVLGPVKIRSIDDMEILRVYATAQAATFAPLIVELVASSAEVVVEALKTLEESNAETSKICFLNMRLGIETILAKTDGFLGFSCPGFEMEYLDGSFEGLPTFTQYSEIAQLIHKVPHERVIISTGMFFRSHFATFGGPGLGFARTVLEKKFPGFAHLVLRDNALKWLDFDWCPPTVEAVVKKQIWICNVCGKQGDDDVQNYTKLGFLYCSMPCLAAHRKTGFKQITKSS